MAKTYNKIVYGGSTLIDLTADTVEASDVLKGKTFHAKSGEAKTGTCEYDANTSDATASASEILKDSTAYVGGAKVTGTMPNIGKQEGKITTKDQVISISAGYHDGSGSVKIDPTEQAKIIAGNIMQGVTILGVTGTLNPGSNVVIEASKTATPKTTSQTILPSTGKDALAQVVVEPIPYNEALNAAGGYTATIANS